MHRPLIHRRRVSTWRWLRLLLPGLLVWFAGCATVPTEFRARPALARADRTALNLRVFDAAWTLVNEKYFDAKFRGVDWPAQRAAFRPRAAQAADDDALYAVLNEMNAQLKESHLAAITPRRRHERRTAHRAVVGLRWQKVEDLRVVTEVVAGGPADAAGVEPGWIAETRDGLPIPDQVIFQGRTDRPVTYGFLDRQDRPRTVMLTPQLINFERREARTLAGGWVYVRFDHFGRAPLRWLSETLKAHRDAPGAIIDLRANGGGNALALSVAAAEFFDRGLLDRRGALATGTVVERNGRGHVQHALPWFSARYAGRVAILIGPATASAAEIFSHVLKHHGRAQLIGRPTAGAVVFSRFYDLPDGGELQVPVRDYIGLEGQRLEGNGVAPDWVIEPRSLADWRSGRDPELEAALRWLEAPAP